MPPDMSELDGPASGGCGDSLHPRAIEGLEEFNRGRYFEAHESLEAAWRDETGPIRDLYRGILQAAVVYLHVTRGNYAGAVKVYQRSQRWLGPWPETCRGVQVGRLRRDLEAVIREVRQLGPGRMDSFRISLLQPVAYDLE